MNALREIRLDSVLYDANGIYRKHKEEKGEAPRDIQSDQILALAEALINAINKAGEVDDEE